jgi:hypothetical protein
MAEKIFRKETENNDQSGANVSGLKNPTISQHPVKKDHLENRRVNNPPSETEDSQFDPVRRLSLLGKTSATEKLLGLDLKPTMIGVLIPPPGNSDFIRDLSPTRRRTILRNLLSQQRKRMQQLAKFLRDEKENEGSFNTKSARGLKINSSDLSKMKENKFEKSLSDLDKAAKMLDVLDGLLKMQDITLSQIGSYSRG